MHVLTSYHLCLRFRTHPQNAILPALYPPATSLQAFAEMAQGKKTAMRTYNEFQVKQLTRLIEVTRTNLSRADRQKVRLKSCSLHRSSVQPSCCC